MIHFILATFVEAKPIIEYFNLKKKIGKLQFDIFQSLNKRISLTVSGIGKIEAVAAVIYTNMYFGGLRNNVWINVGIAGHENQEIGEIFIISKNEDFATKKRYFPSINFKSNLASINCITYDLPDSKYSDSLSDMELSGFYQSK